MGEMKGGGERRSRPGVARRRIGQLIAVGVLLVLLAPAYAAYGLLYSGRLALAQEAPSGEILKGFDFGPVWLQTGEVGRFYIDARLPKADTAVWYTTFEVLNAEKKPVFRQDEVRFIGEQQFTAGSLDRSQHQFTLEKDTGYYYFRFKAHNGTFAPESNAPPAVRFTIRQRVWHGAGLWGVAAGLLALGLLLTGLALARISMLGAAAGARPEPGAADRAAERTITRRLAPRRDSI